MCQVPDKCYGPLNRHCEPAEVPIFPATVKSLFTMSTPSAWPGRPGEGGPGTAAQVSQVLSVAPAQGSHVRRSGSGHFLQGCLKLFQLH